MRKNLILIVKTGVLAFVYLYVIFALSGEGFNIQEWDTEMNCIMILAWLIITIAFVSGYYEKPCNRVAFVYDEEPETICPRCGSKKVHRICGDYYVCINCSKNSTDKTN